MAFGEVNGGGMVLYVVCIWREGGEGGLDVYCRLAGNNIIKKAGCTEGFVEAHVDT